MVLSIYATFSLATLLAVSVHHVELSPLATPTIFTTIRPTDDAVDSDNDTDINVTAYQSTKYMYLDFPRIGYRIFLKKILEALQLLNFFMKMDPMILKLTRTYLFFNRTGENTAGLQPHNTTREDGNMETNTEAPPQFQLADETENDSQTSHQLSMSEDTEKATKEDDIKQSKVKPQGFFSRMANAVSSVFHTFTNWF